MQTTTIPHVKLRLSESNVRKANVESGLEALAASIAEHGLLQPLIVSPAKGRKTLFDVYAGGRRWRAIGLLIERGVLPKDYAVDVRLADPPPCSGIGAEVGLCSRGISQNCCIAVAGRA